MSAPANRPAAQLFNNPTLSDITIKQIYHGETRNSNFKVSAMLECSTRLPRCDYLELIDYSQEATETMIELHDDDPGHFELLLKYIYTYDYDIAMIDDLAAGNVIKRMLIPISIYVVADKYDIPDIHEAVGGDLRSRLRPKSVDLLVPAVKAYYSCVAGGGGYVGEILASIILEGNRDITMTVEYKQSILDNPAFGADMALALTRDTIHRTCHHCQHNYTFRKDALSKEISNEEDVEIVCPFCKKLAWVCFSS